MVRNGIIVLIWVAAAMAAPEPTFNKDILPILQKNCQICHRPGEIGPASFLTYDSTRPWAKAIKTAVLTRKMPPWFADPKYGHFANDRRLSDREMQTIAAWVDAGAPEGNTKDKPAPAEWTEGWNIKPDVVLGMQKPYQVPAKGTVLYTYFVVPTGFTKDTWVTDAEVRPGNRAVVHHASVHVRPPGSQWLKDARPGEAFVPSSRGDGPAPPAPVDPNVNTSNEWLLGYVPGTQTQSYFDLSRKAAKLIPAGSDIVFEMHYTANGNEAEDQTKVGFVVAKQTPQYRLLTVPVFDDHFLIPPGAPNYEAHALATFNQPVQLIYSQPHMHLRGKDMDIHLQYPTGESETLVSVPHYDFNWQMIYFEKQPRQLPKGTRVELTAHWDNSATNKYNPDPTKAIRWGEQSWDEMIFAWVGVVVPHDADPGQVISKN
ncbi:MAG: thiol-disulfide isomerase [Terriglobia bacterium]|nr:MAG: thiol-disulfide isomerase [Terriglobia bacterium]